MLEYLISVSLILTSCLALEIEYGNDEDIYLATKESLEEFNTLKLTKRSDKPTSVCYDKVGCFNASGPFQHLGALPESPESLNTLFYLYTRQHLKEPQTLDNDIPESIINSDINPNLPLIFIAHGFGGRIYSDWIQDIKDALLEKEDVNVILISWIVGARLPFYSQAARNTELVGAQAADLYLIIKDKLGIQEKNVHFIGFSLGAHVAGFFGKKLQQFRGIKPGRITGLDPAGPSFEDYSSDVHLYKDDADYVDVIHTNADHSYKGGLGMGKPIGHVDFYPNGGKRQPGCQATAKGAFWDLVKGSKKRKSCNHSRAPHLYAESIRRFPECEFIGYKCSSYEEFKQAKCMKCDGQCGRMGYKAQGSGSYFLLTQSSSPYCGKMAQLIVKYHPNLKSSKGIMMLTLVSKTGERENITITSAHLTSYSLYPGQEIKKATVIRTNFQNIDHIEALYLKYKNFVPFTSGRSKFGLASVIIKDTEDQIIYKSCNEVILHDKQYVILESSVEDCK